MKADVAQFDIENARELVANQVLWPRIRDFLWDFAPQVHESWLEDCPCDISGNERNAPRIKRLVLDSLGVEPVFHTFPKDDGSRILLLDAATLESVAKWLGALACAESLRHVTSGSVVRELKAALPGVYPEVFGYTAYFRDFAAKNAKDAKTADEILAAGLEILASAVSAVPESLASRLKFKIPKNLCGLCVPCGEKGTSRIAFQAILKLLKLKFPEAYSLCCS
jgi:hypothetical protein